MYGIVSISDKDSINYDCLVHNEPIRVSNDKQYFVVEWKGDVCDDHIKLYLIDGKEWTKEDIQEEIVDANWVTPDWEI